ncbi:MAG: GGDEF domain-containing protein [Denitromonas halophila]|nr:MAG: GGDEF domain-containing protein [Denitromonas halophila]
MMASPAPRRGCTLAPKNRNFLITAARSRSRRGVRARRRRINSLMMAIRCRNTKDLWKTRMRTRTGDSLLALLKAAQHLTSLHARETLLRAFCVGVQRALRAERCDLRVLGVGLGRRQLKSIGWCNKAGAGGDWDDAVDGLDGQVQDVFLAQAIDNGASVTRVHDADGWRMAFPVLHAGRVRSILDVHATTAIAAVTVDGVRAYVHCFERLMAHWDYANLDTLTGLLNRKTFDEQFDQLIAVAERARRQDGERREDSALPSPAWLGIVDIDHFKHINDTWGHLFGDEVLIRLADCMRSAFRSSDKLFRFGGEEFVVMLRNVPAETVSSIFERFRIAVETHDFPQVGTVTCSIGFAQVDDRLPPAELLGRADSALYYGKAHGRNCVWAYEDLVAAGELVSTTATSSAQQDADEYF